jgi:hypothetical protein
MGEVFQDDGGGQFKWEMSVLACFAPLGEVEVRCWANLRQGARALAPGAEPQPALCLAESYQRPRSFLARVNRADSTVGDILEGSSIACADD